MTEPEHPRSSAPSTSTSIGSAAAGRDSTINIDNSTTINHVSTAGPPVVEAGSGLMVVGRIPRRAPYFVDRVQVRELQETLARCAVAVVVCGMRGAGKTQVAAACARELIAAGGPRLVAWVNAETSEALYTGLAEIADRVGAADPDGDSAVSARRLRDHLSERRDPALLVLDNATDPDLLDTVLPVGGVTRVVVTSTDRTFDQFGELIDAGEGFARPESVRYLEEATNLDDEPGANLVATDLGDLPLALAAAAATITGRRLDYHRYRQLLAEGSLSAVLPRRRGSDHPLAVDQALLLAVQTVETSAAEVSLEDAVRWLLGVLSMLAPEGVDRAMLPNKDGRLDEALQRCVEGSLLSWSDTGHVVVMHRLLARVLREGAHSLDSFNQIVADSTEVLRPLLFDESEAFRRRDEGSRLIGHIEALRNAVRGTNLGADRLANVLAARRWATRQLLAAADTTRSITQAEDTHIDHAGILGRSHPDTLSSRNNLALAYRSAGRLTEAISLFEALLVDRERISGDAHPSTLTARNNLALTYGSAGRLGEAIALYEKALTDAERALGTEHPDILASRNNLALAYKAAGRLDQAIELFERTLDDAEAVLGIDHPDTLDSRNNLAGAYTSAGRLTEAISLYERTLADAERLLVVNDPIALTARNNLAGAYTSAGRLTEAVSLLERTLADAERALGANHPQSLSARYGLAMAFTSEGRFDEAISIFEAVLADYQRIVGAEHIDTMTARHGLALAFRSAGRLTEAIALFEKTFADRKKLLGEDHPDTVAARHGLALVHLSEGRVDEAIILFERVLADCQRVLGPDHPDIFAVRNNLALAYTVVGRSGEAVELCERTLADALRVLDADHPHIVVYRDNLATVQISNQPQV
ncbi:tetratricopeptide repeat protein [Nocardia takedensis]